MLTCSTCEYKIKTGNKLADPFICVRYPPTAQAVMQQGMAGAQPAVINFYPNIFDGSPACGEYKDAPKLLA